MMSFKQILVVKETFIMTLTGNVSFENDLLNEMWVTHDKKRHDSIYDKFDKIAEHSLKLRAKL
ncbi:MAG: hypothetical protein ABI597_07995 [Gammaproteobacteria bacterium]